MKSSFIRWNLPPIIWGIIIFSLTSYPKLKIPDIGFNATDKLAHFGVYFIFGFLVIRAYVKGVEVRLSFLIKSVILTVSLAFIDELHQLFIPGRHGDISDFLADLFGILLAQVIFMILFKKFNFEKAIQESR